MTRHCDNCGRAIGRIDSETFEGRIVCLRCAKKLKAEQSGGNGVVTDHSNLQLIIAASATVVAVGLLMGVLNWLFNLLFE